MCAVLYAYALDLETAATPFWLIERAADVRMRVGHSLVPYCKRQKAGRGLAGNEAMWDTCTVYNSPQPTAYSQAKKCC